MKKSPLLLFVSLIFACGSSSIKDIDFSKINEPCDLVDAGELIVDCAYEIQQQYDGYNEEDIPAEIKLEITMIMDKINELEKCGDKNDWELEDYENCSNFEEVNRKYEELDF